MEIDLRREDRQLSFTFSSHISVARSTYTVLVDGLKIAISTVSESTFDNSSIF